jgi:stage V sporulation protein D (sporulation-specific penicillin-binding protein)
MRQTTPKVFAKYVRDFGFGEFTGIELDRENAGNITNVNTGKEIYTATASFGQGLTVTPLQMVNAVSVLANGGKLMKPHVVSQKNYSNGTVEVIEPQIVRQVISSKAAAVTSGMLVSVVENGHGKLAAVPGYRVAGKTGTAQVPAKNGKGYDENDVIVSFVGFAPFSDPRFSMIVMLDRPQYGKEAATTVTKTFGEVAKFILQYYNVPHDK